MSVHVRLESQRIRVAFALGVRQGMYVGAQAPLSVDLMVEYSWRGCSLRVLPVRSRQADETQLQSQTLLECTL